MDLRDLIIFKNWAEEVYFKYIEELTEEQFEEVIPTVNKSIKQLLSHILDSYWGDFHLLTDRDWSNPYDLDKMGSKEIISGIKEYNTKILDFMENNDLNKVITYEEPGFEKPIKTNAENVIFNFVEHTTYHRGQMALLLRYHGVPSIKQTDFNPYIWDKSQE